MKIIWSLLPRFRFTSFTDICMHLLFLIEAHIRYRFMDLFMVIFLVWDVLEVFS